MNHSKFTQQRRAPRGQLKSVLIISLLTWPAAGANRTWTGDAFSNQWSEEDNWSPDGPPQDGDTLIFGNNASHKSNNNDLLNLRVHSIVFNGTSGGYTLNGNSILLNSDITAAHSSGFNSVRFGVQFINGGGMFSVVNGGRLEVGGMVTLANNQLLGIHALGTNLTISGAIVGDGELLKLALDADTKLVPTWFVGTRDAGAAYHFMHDLAGRLASRVQLTTDGHRAYLNAVEDAFGSEIDFAQLVKIYGNALEGGEVRYSPAVCMGARKAVISGKPEFKHVSTSFVERQNLTMRMSMRRFTRLTNGFSKTVSNHEHSLAVHYMFYNFGRIHQSLRVTPAMEAGVSDHVWSLEEIIALLDSN